MPVRRCYVTALFVDLCASTRMGDALDPELYADVLRQVQELVDTTVSDYDGVVNQFYGDGVLAVFGLPEPREDDVTRAINAALALHQLIAEIKLPTAKGLPEYLQFHTGLDSGLVVAEEGDFIQGRYRIIGDSLNTAARLSDAASPGEIIASEKTIASVLPYFDTQPVTSLSLKGKQGSMQAYRILSPSTVSNRFEASKVSGFTHFIGRKKELEKLSAMLDRATFGESQAITIIGEAGVGKTRLVDSFIDDITMSSVNVHRIYCREEYSSEPLQPLVLLLKSLLGLGVSPNFEEVYSAVKNKLNGLEEDYCNLFIHFLFPSDKNIEGADAAANLRDVTTGILFLLNKLGEVGPVIIFLDDWQNADERSRFILKYILRKSSSLKLMVVATVRVRDEEVSACFGEDIELRAFSFDESKQVISTLINDNELGLAATIYQQSGGNALFIEELCRSILVVGSSQGSPVIKLEVPTSLHGLIAARIKRLGDHSLNIIRAAAVIGSVFELSLLELVLAKKIKVESLNELVSIGILYPLDFSNNIRFKHGLIREALYETINLAERQTLHRRVVEVMEQSSDKLQTEKNIERLAYHYGLCGEAHLAIKYSIQSGNRALDIFALDRARYQFFNALSAMRELEQTKEQMLQYVDITRRYALVSTYYPNKNDIGILEYALICANLIEDDVSIAQSEYWLGWIHYALGLSAKALIHYQRSYSVVVSSGDSELAALRQLTLGQAYSVMSDYDKAIELFSGGLSMLADRNDNGQRAHSADVEVAYAIANYGIALADMGDFITGETKISEALEMIEGKNNGIEASICALFSAVLIWRGQWDEAAELARRVQYRAEQINGPYVFTMGKALEAFTQWKTTGDKSALNILEKSLNWLESRGIHFYISFVYGWLAQSLVEAGESKKALQYAQRGLNCVERQDLVGVAMCYRVLAVLSKSSLHAQLDSCDTYLEKALLNAKQRKSAHEIAVTRLEKARLRLAEGRCQDARELLNKVIPAFKSMKMDWHLAQAHQLSSEVLVCG